MIFEDSNHVSQSQASSQFNLGKYDARSEAPSVVSVPSVSGGMGSTQSLSFEANSMVNFQLQCEMQRINDSLRNIGQILGSSANLMSASQYGQSMQ